MAYLSFTLRAIFATTILFFQAITLATNVPYPNAIIWNWNELVFKALSLEDINYKYGGNNPESGFDCSGFVKYVIYNTIGFSLPRSSYEISKLGVKISKQHLIPGDLVFFKTIKNTISHIGIYIGDNKFIHASFKAKKIQVDYLHSRYWQQRYVIARRISKY